MATLGLCGVSKCSPDSPGRYEDVHALRHDALDVLPEQTGKAAFNPYPFDSEQRRCSRFGVVLEDDVFKNASRAREIRPMKSADFHLAEALVLQVLYHHLSAEGPVRCQENEGRKKHDDQGGDCGHYKSA